MGRSRPRRGLWSVLGVIATVTSLVVAIGACSSPPDEDEPTGDVEQGLRRSDGGACRSASLEAKIERKRRGLGFTSTIGSATFTPSFRFALPGEIDEVDVDPDKASDKVDVTLTSTLGGVSIACLYRQSSNDTHPRRDRRSEPRRHRHHGEDCTKDDAFELVSCTDATLFAGAILTADRVTLSVTLSPNIGAVREASAELV